MPNLKSKEGVQLLEEMKEELKEGSTNGHNNQAKNKKDNELEVEEIIQNFLEDEKHPDYDDPIDEAEMIRIFQEADRARYQLGVGIPSAPTRQTNVSLRGTKDIPSWADIDEDPEDHL